MELYEALTLGASVSCGFPTGRWGVAKRQPVHAVVSDNHWDQPVSWEMNDAHWEEPDGYGQ